MSLLWLPNSVRKDICLPKVVFEEPSDQDYSGYYIPNTNVIVVVHSDYEDAIIAHEFCHYWQQHNYRAAGYGPWEIIGSYEESIKRYFKSYSWEMEALLFEHRISKNYLNDWWLRKLVLE
jgi:hypothetical protein